MVWVHDWNQLEFLTYGTIGILSVRQGA